MKSRIQSIAHKGLSWFGWLCLTAAAGAQAQPQIGSNCLASLGNRSVQISSDGTFAIPNIPADQGLFRLRVVCKNLDQTTTQGQSDYLTLQPNAVTDVINLSFGNSRAAPVSLLLTVPKTTMSAKGETTFLSVTGTLPSGDDVDLSTSTQGTSYSSSSPAIANVTPDGLVTALSRGTAIITARNEGATATVQLDVNIPLSTLNDGIPDSWKIAHHLNPLDPGVSGQDPDADGLTNLEEYQLGTDPNNPDTDGDGLSDGQERKLGTNPLRADTDGDGLLDGQEVQLTTNPLFADTDGDGILDGIEVKLGLNPLVPDVTTTVQGRVLNGSNQPVSDAAVVVFGLLTGVTDNTGFFSIRNVPATVGTLTAIARVTLNNAILEGQSAPTSPVADGLTNVGLIQLGQSSGGVSGIVTDLQNRPLFNVRITINIASDTRQTITDINGLYAFSGLTPNSFTVTASDPSTGLRGQASGTLFPNSSAVANIQIQASGTVRGRVLAVDGTSPVAQASVVLSGSSLATTTTDQTGQFVFDYVPLGTYTLDASDFSGNRGRATGAITRTAQVVASNIVFLGLGSISGTVRDGSQTPVANATVSLNSHSIFGGTDSTSTDASGNYAFGNVFIGNFDVVASSDTLELGGRAGGSITSDGQSVTADIALGPAGTVVGTIFRHNAVTPVPFAHVDLTGGFTTDADFQGQYELDFVPLGTYAISVTDPNSPDQGAGSVTLATQGDQQTADITLNGLGSLVVTVVDAANTPSVDALVTVTSPPTSGKTFSGITQADGKVTFSQISAGAFSVTASDPVTQAGTGPTSGSLSAGEVANLTLQLQPVGSVTGKVFAANGVTPVANVTVTLSNPLVAETTTSGADGGFLFNSVPSGTYTLRALDGGGTVRAQAVVTVVSPAVVVTQDLVLAGFGNVAGTVFLSSGGPAANTLVTVTDSSGKALFGLTDVTGAYAVEQVAVGTFTAQAILQNSPQVQTGSSVGQITSNGATAVANIQLIAESRPLPVTLYDGNGLPYTVAGDGSLQGGLSTEFQGVAGVSGAVRMSVVSSGGTSIPFTGNFTANTANNGRELDISQPNVAGLDITRKIYVPRDGYFARYLEVLHNSSGSDITVGLQFNTLMRAVTRFSNPQNMLFAPILVATSSGDNILDLNTGPDHWVLVDDDTDSDPFLFGNLPPITDVFDGPGGMIQAATAQWIYDAQSQGNLLEQFNNIVVPAGGQIAFLHFLSAQVDRAGGLASAQRLLRLPPEALTGIDPNDLAAVRNFVVPPGGLSQVASLDALAGQITGQVLSGNGTIGIPNARISFQSSEPLFARTRFFAADDNGNFNIAAQFDDLGTSIPVPVTGFTLQATDLQSGFESPSTIGNFPPGSNVAQQNIVFTGAGVLSGTVRTANGDPVSSGTVRIVQQQGEGGDAVAANLSGVQMAAVAGSPLDPVVPIASDGTYHAANLPSGTYDLTALVPGTQGGPTLIATTTATIFQGQDAVVDITVQPTGSVTGTVFDTSHVPFPNLPVSLHTGAGDYQATTDTQGNFVFPEALPGVATVEAYDPVSQGGAGATISVLAGQSINQNLTLVTGAGSVTGTVTEFGFPVAGANVTVRDANNTVYDVTAGPDGVYSAAPVAVGPITVTVHSPFNGGFGQATGFLGFPGTSVTIDVPIQRQGSWNFGPWTPDAPSALRTGSVTVALKKEPHTAHDPNYRLDRSLK